MDIGGIILLFILPCLTYDMLKYRLRIRKEVVEMRIRKSISLLLVIAFVITSFAPAYAANVRIDNQNVQFTEGSGVPFIDSAHRTQVPFRQTMEAFGCVVDWDNGTRTAVAEKDGITVEVPIDQPYIFKNGQKILNDTAALIKDGRTYLPIRAVLEAFGAQVDWDNNSQTVLVFTDSTGTIMEVHFIDVGQADAIFIDYGSYEILVDGGNKGNGGQIVNYIKPYVDGNIELIIATHVHADHIGGLADVINAYQVDKIIHSDETSTTIAFQNFYNAAMSSPNTSYIGDIDMAIDMGGGALFRILEMGDDYSNSNENSVISMIDYNDIEILLMGDLESSIENRNLNKFQDINVLKAGHHGSKTSSSQSFLNVTKPEAVIISAGLNNQYNHPHEEALQRFSAIGADVYGTFKSGHIVLTTNGNTYNINSSNKVTTLDAGDKGTAPTQPTTPTVTKPETPNDSVTKNEASYVGNSNTKKFHKSACRYVSQIKQSNLVYFKAKLNATNAGYEACKVCNP